MIILYAQNSSILIWNIKAGFQGPSPFHIDEYSKKTWNQETERGRLVSPVEKKATGSREGHNLLAVFCYLNMSDIAKSFPDFSQSCSKKEGGIVDKCHMEIRVATAGETRSPSVTVLRLTASALKKGRIY